MTQILLSELRRAKRERERAARRAEVERHRADQQALRAWQAEQARRRREQERFEKEKARELAAVERARAAELARQQRERDRQRQTRERLKREQDALALKAEKAEKVAAEKAARDLARRTMQEEKERRKAHIDQQIAEAASKTASLAMSRSTISEVLNQRLRGLEVARPEVRSAHELGGSRGLESILMDVMNTVDDARVGRLGSSLYRDEADELIVELLVPDQSIVPLVEEFKYNRSRDEVVGKARKPAEVRSDYASLVARLTLRTIRELLDLCPDDIVNNVVVNAMLETIDKSTGEPVKPCLISVGAEREHFDRVHLDEPDLDPVMCLRTFLNAIVSPHPYDHEAVVPVLEYDLSRYKIIEEMRTIAGLDSRLDLLRLKPVEFEHLVRHLFEKIGLKAWVTQASRDDGVDAVAVNEDPIMGGVCVIQAKRYSKIVPLESINALAGVMNDKSASRGVLVTTSWVGQSSRDFAARNGRMQIIEGRELKALLLEHLNIDALISLDKVPPNWLPSDVE